MREKSEDLNRDRAITRLLARDMSPHRLVQCMAVAGGHFKFKLSLYDMKYEKRIQEMTDSPFVQLLLFQTGNVKKIQNYDYCNQKTVQKNICKNSYELYKYAARCGSFSVFRFFGVEKFSYKSFLSSRVKF